MKISKRVVTAVMILVTAVLIGLDIIVGTDGIDDNTISEIMSNAAISFPLIPFGWGVLMSHFFFLRKWDSYVKPQDWYWNVRYHRYYWLALSAIIVIVLGVLNLSNIFTLPLYFIVGMVVGYELFPQFKENFKQ